MVNRLKRGSVSLFHSRSLRYPFICPVRSLTAPAKGALQLALEQLLDEAPDGLPSRVLQRIEPTVCQEWQRHIVRRNASSWRRLLLAASEPPG